MLVPSWNPAIVWASLSCSANTGIIVHAYNLCNVSNVSFCKITYFIFNKIYRIKMFDTALIRFKTTKIDPKIIKLGSILIVFKISKTL